MDIDTINHSAIQYAACNVDRLKKYCDSLHDFGVRVFAYFRFFNNGRYLYLCNNIEWVKFCIERVHSNDNTSLGQQIGYASKDGYHCYLWPTHQDDYLLAALFDFNIWNGLSIFKQKEDESIELWGLAGDRQSANMQNFYVEHIELLKDFISLFSINESEIIKPSQYKLAIYKDFREINTHYDAYELAKIQEFVRITSVNKYPIICNGDEVLLTLTEHQCINLLSMGKSAKQIAHHIQSSARTIEKHLENVRKKLKCSDRNTLINMYKKSISSWL